MTWCTVCNKDSSCFKRHSTWPVKNILSSLASLPATGAALQIQGGEPFDSYECAQCDVWDSSKQSFLLTSFSFLYSRHNTTSWWSVGRASCCWSWPAVIFDSKPRRTHDPILLSLMIPEVMQLPDFLTSLVIRAGPHQPHSWLQSPWDAWPMFPPRHICVQKLDLLFDEGRGRSLSVGTAFVAL
jgi:hypothetical protein